MYRRGCCGCCAALRPRYKRLVDHIFPPNPDDGLVKSNMEKLIYFALNSPGKLDRIGEYLARRLDRDVYRKRIGYVVISMEALDQLLVACHANSLNLFVESFLQMITRLLECPEPMLQLRATQSFEKYANIKEDTPQYHRRYDFFVLKFTSMCYSNEKDLDMRKKLRTAGIMGLQGLVRKTGSDDLGETIWRSEHMDKIVPALLFNMEERQTQVKQQQESASTDVGDHNTAVDKIPFELAEICLRELISRATLAKISNIIKPLLYHLDKNNLWTSNEFAVQTFQILMYSIQVQYSVSVINMLIGHLNDKSNMSAECRTGIADVLSKVIPIAAGECIGPSVNDIINSLLEQIRWSIIGGTKRAHQSQVPQVDALWRERVYQETLIQALGEYANHLPDYQKIEAMVFILNKVPGSDRIEDLAKNRPDEEIMLQHLLLKSLLKVGSKYTTVHYSATFSHSFLMRLLRMSVSNDQEIRLTVQHIFHKLFDRHDNNTKLGKATMDIPRMKLGTSRLTPKDVTFWKKSGNDILLSLQENCDFGNNTLENIEAVYTSLMLILTEIRHDDVIVDVLRVLFHIQSMASGSASGLTLTRRIQLLAMVAAIMVAVAHCVPALKEHVKAVIEKRSTEAPHLLPELVSHYGSPSPVIDNLDQSFLFDNDAVHKILKESNLDERRLTVSASNMMRRPSTFRHPNSFAEPDNDDDSSTASSPEMPRRIVEEEVTFESLKAALQEAQEKRGKEEEEIKREVKKSLLGEPYEVVLEKMKPPTALQTKLTEILSRLPSAPPSGLPTFLPTPDPPSFMQNAPHHGIDVLSVFADFETNTTANNMSLAAYQLPYQDLVIY